MLIYKLLKAFIKHDIKLRVGVDREFALQRADVTLARHTLSHMLHDPLEHLLTVVRLGLHVMFHQIISLGDLRDSLVLVIADRPEDEAQDFFLRHQHYAAHEVQIFAE
jgi:hypothetical protein